MQLSCADLALQVAGLAALALLAFRTDAPTPPMLALIMIIFGYGQGLAMAPLSGAALSSVKPVAAGSASDLYGTTIQIGNAVGVAAIGAFYFAVESMHSSRAAFFVVLASFANVNHDQRRISDMDASRTCSKLRHFGESPWIPG